ncbi:hypothetical protein Taro_028821 [Colocasia esculenta]|uniref:Uncharacterized protein n=1 Tax=Colocasia esculenta TaxID=4460 RepID=A0A843VP98_COLES|nr:hypothetical protein [Colocasia esculenta]
MTSVCLSSASEPGRRVRLCPVRTPCGRFEPVGLRRLPFQASLATPVLVLPSCILWLLGDVLERE